MSTNDKLMIGKSEKKLRRTKLLSEVDRNHTLIGSKFSSSQRKLFDPIIPVVITLWRNLEKVFPFEIENKPLTRHYLLKLVKLNCEILRSGWGDGLYVELHCWQLVLSLFRCQDLKCGVTCWKVERRNW